MGSPALCHSRSSLLWVGLRYVALRFARLGLGEGVTESAECECLRGGWLEAVAAPARGSSAMAASGVALCPCFSSCSAATPAMPTPRFHRLSRPSPCHVRGAFSAVPSQSGGNSPGFSPRIGNDKAIGKLESLFYTDSGIPEEKIERPTGLPKGTRAIGNKPRCPVCEAKGAVECATCSGSGLYVDAVLESQGIIVKVRCMGCGGAGNHMCLECGGRGHV